MEMEFFSSESVNKVNQETADGRGGAWKVNRTESVNWREAGAKAAEGATYGGGACHYAIQGAGAGWALGWREPGRRNGGTDRKYLEQSDDIQVLS